MEPVGQGSVSYRMSPPPALMSLEAFKRLLEQFPDLRELQLQGTGEPLAHPRFFEMVKYAAERGIEVSTQSSLATLDERRADECVASGLRRLTVCVDPADPRFGRVLRHVARLIEAKRRSASSQPEIRLAALLTRRNLERLPELVRVAREFGVERVVLSSHKELKNEDPVRLQRYLHEGEAAAKEFGVALGRAEPAPTGPNGQMRCAWPWRGAYISSSGAAMPCCKAAKPDWMSFGNMHRDGVAAVWNNARYNQFRDRLASDDPPEVCSRCEVYRGSG